MKWLFSVREYLIFMTLSGSTDASEGEQHEYRALRCGGITYAKRGSDQELVVWTGSRVVRSCGGLCHRTVIKQSLTRTGLKEGCGLKRVPPRTTRKPL